MKLQKTSHIKQWMQSLIHAEMIGYTPHKKVDRVTYTCLDDWLHQTSISGCSHLSIHRWLVTPHIKQWIQSLIHAWMIGYTPHKQRMQSLIHAWMIGYTLHQTVDAVTYPCLDDWLHPTSNSGCSHLSIHRWLVTPHINSGSSHLSMPGWLVTPTSVSGCSHLSMPGWLVTPHIIQLMQSLIHAWMIGYTPHQTVDAVTHPCLDDWLHPTPNSGCSH